MKTIRPATMPNQPLYGPLKAGDTVIVQTPDGERWRFVVQAIDGTAIVAPEGKRYERADVVRLQRKAFSGPRTIGLVAGLTAGVLLIFGIAVASAYGDLLSGGY